VRTANRIIRAPRCCEPRRMRFVPQRILGGLLL
jgi:hypothetical protein